MRHDLETLECPCGSTFAYQNCCGQYITNAAPAPTPEALMRSRYTAFTQANVDYIEKTMRGEAKKHFDKASAKEWAESAKWQKLTIIDAPAVNPKDTVGHVEFTAEFSENNEAQFVHERSHFEKIDGEWFYTDGLSMATETHIHDENCSHHYDKPHHQHNHAEKKIKIGRNDLCPCGSGKKYKKCCL